MSSSPRQGRLNTINYSLYIETNSPPTSARQSNAYSLYGSTASRASVSPLKEGKVNVILEEAIRLVEAASSELEAITRSAKGVEEIVRNLALLVDKQIVVVGDLNPGEGGRVKSSILSLCENLRTSHGLLATACNRMKGQILSGQAQLDVHQKNLQQTKTPRPSPRNECLKESCRSLSESVPSTPRPPIRSNSQFIKESHEESLPRVTSTHSSEVSSLQKQVTLAFVLADPSSQRPQAMSQEAFAAILTSSGLRGKDSYNSKDLRLFFGELLSRSIAKNKTLSYFGKAYHRRLIPAYAREVTIQLLRSFQSISEDSVSAVHRSALFEFMCVDPREFESLLDRVYIVSGKNEAMCDHDLYRSDSFLPSRPTTANTMQSSASRSAETFPTKSHALEQSASTEGTIEMARLLHNISSSEWDSQH